MEKCPHCGLSPNEKKKGDVIYIGPFTLFLCTVAVIVSLLANI